MHHRLEDRPTPRPDRATVHVGPRSRTRAAAATLTGALALLLSAMLLLATGAQASACGGSENDFTGSVSRAWNVKGNWSKASVPTSGEEVCIPEGLSGSVTVPAKTTAEAKILHASSPLTIEKEATLAIAEKVAPEEPKANEEHASRFAGLTVEDTGTLSTAGAWIMLSGNVLLEGTILSIGNVNLKNEDVARLLSGTLSGNGTFEIPFSNIAGTIEPGAAGIVGELHFTLLSSQQTTGTLVLDLASNTSFDQLSDATSNFFWKGTLEVNLIGGYTPVVGTKWEFMSKGPGDPAEFETFIPTTFTARSVSGGVELESLPVPPTVVTEPASTVTQSSATLNGTVNPNHKVVLACTFEYGTTTSYEASKPCSAIGSAGSSPVAVDAEATGLSANTTYHFRIVAKNEAGKSEGIDRTFKTSAGAPAPPQATTGGATAVTQTTATLNATANPEGAEITSCTLDYGSGTVTEHGVSCAVVGSGSSTLPVSAPISGLTPNTTYHFKIVVKNGNGSGEGEEVPFTTPPNLKAVEPGGSGGEKSSTPSTGSSGVLGSTAASPATNPAAVEALLLGCSRSQLVLNDAYIHGSRVLLIGSAAKSLIGKKVKIIFGTGSQQVASTTVKANGEYSTTAPLPPARIREALTTRYTAEIGSQRSLHLKLTRRLELEPPKASAGTVTLSGRVFLPLTKPISPIVVEQQLECGKTTVIDTFTPPASGLFHLTLRVPANARAGIYTLKSKVAANLHAVRHGFTTYSLPLPVILG
jgi:hypothetical protein